MRRWLRAMRGVAACFLRLIGPLAKSRPLAALGADVYWFLLVPILIAAAVWGIFWARRRFIQNVDDAEAEMAFTLQDLREMRARGDLNEVEYQSMRAAMLDQAQAGTADPLTRDDE